MLQSQVHKHAQKFGEVQLCTLLSIKTGGCAEDCAFCPQSSKYKTEVKATRMLDKDTVLEAARQVNLQPCRAEHFFPNFGCG